MMLTIIAKQVVRTLRKDKIHMLFNVLGLSLGLTVSILVLLYVQQVLNFDKFHLNRDRIYRFGVSMTIGASPTSTQPGCSPGTGPLLKQAIPGIEDFVRTLYLGTSRVTIDESVFTETAMSLMWADNSIFRVFTFPLLSGNKETALERPNTMVLTQELAQKYFGTKDVLGKIVKIENAGDFEITGVLKEVPENSGLQFSALLSMVTINSLNPGDYQIAGLSSNMGSWLFFLFSKGFNTEDFNNSFKTWYKENMASVDRINYVAVVEPYTDFYLHSVISSRFSQSNRMVLTGFISIGLLLLILACVNYINLTTSRSDERAKEIGIRKISGANERSLRIQLIGESVVITYLSMTLALVFTEFLLNFTRVRVLISSVNDIIGVNVSLNPFNNPSLLAGILLLPLIIGVLAGFYPAFLMSKMSPAIVIKAAHGGATGKSFLRKFLIVFQFTISIGALILSLLMSKQIEKISNVDPGFDPENLLYISCTNQSVKNRFKIYRENISASPDIISTSFSDRSPGQGHPGQALRWQKESGEMEAYPAVFVSTDKEYFKTLGINLKEGSGFSRLRLPADTVLDFIVNETFVKSLEWKNGVGKQNERGKTIGVISDYHYNSLTDPLRPMFILQYREDRIPNILNVRISGENRDHTLAFLKKTWEETIPEIPFDFVYSEDLLKNLYSSSKNQGVITNWLAITCLIISCFGMLSFSSYIAYRKRKNFVLRKIYGATSSRIFSEFSMIIFRIVLLSSLIATLLSWLGYNEWSKNFAYNPPLNIWIFIGSVSGMLLLAILTTAYHVISTAHTNPVKNLKNE